GCRWARAGGCTMCGYVAESVEGGSVSHDALMAQIQVCLDHEAEAADEESGLIKIYTSGSFLDEREVPAETRQAIAETFADRDRIVVESLPDFVDREKVREFTDQGLETDVAVGLETATDRVRHDCVNKYFDFADFEAACEEARAGGGGVKAYLLLKPPFLSEQEALADMQSSVRRCGAVEGCHTVSMNPCNVQRYTMVDELFYEGGYRPPWLWSVAEVLRTTTDVDAIVVSDPVGHGSDRGAHNCGECDDRVQRAIKDFDLRQDPSVFEQVECECEFTWELVLEEEKGFNTPLAR
ncbi:MAG: archaeosine biosynthesis radical SAM protein RaSEA, partial [Halolamina sp.]